MLRDELENVRKEVEELKVSRGEQDGRDNGLRVGVNLEDAYWRKYKDYADRFNHANELSLTPLQLAYADSLMQHQLLKG